METLYQKLSPELLQKMVDGFYEQVFSSEVLKPLFQTDKQRIKDKQFAFLTQFMGGPPIYSEQFGHPRMRMRHLPHRIDFEAKEEWLRCMRLAINELPITDELKAEVYAIFPQVAQHMVNS